MLNKWPSLVILLLMIASQIIYGQVEGQRKEPVPSCIKQPTKILHNEREAPDCLQKSKTFRQYRIKQDTILSKKNITVFIP